MPYRNGWRGMASGLQPTSAKSCISLHHGLGLRDPPLWGLETHFYQWRSPRSSLGCGGTCTSHLRSTSVCWRHSARRLSTSSEWSLTWNGEGTETHSWCCTVPLFVPSLTMVALCMAQHQTPTYDNWTAFITRDWDWHWEHSAPAQCPACTEANEAPLEERRLKLSMHYYVKTHACIDNPAHHALHEFDQTTRDLYAPRPNGRGGMSRPLAAPIGLKVEEAMTSAEINAELVCPLRTPNFPPGTHDYDPKRHDLIEGVSKCMISGQVAQAKFNEFREAQGSHDEVYTDGSKMNERVRAAAVINRHFQNGETTCRQLSKRLPDNSTIFAAEATAISLALNCYQHMGPVHHDVVVYSDSMSCLQAIEGEDTENPFICHIMNLLWSLSDKGTRVRFCWVPSHCGIDGNERVDQLAKETLDQDIDPLASVHYTDMKPLVNSYIQKLVQTKWDIAVHGRDLYLVKPTLGPPKKFQHLTRAEEVVITRLRIDHTKATKSHILSRGPPTGCHHCGQTLTIEHMLLECALL